MSTTAKVALGVAGVAIVYFVIRARAQTAAQNYYTAGYPPPAPPPGAPPPAVGYTIETYGPTTEARTGRGHF